MKRPQYVEGALRQAEELESLLCVLSMVVDGEQVAGTTFSFAGGGTVLDMAANMAGEIVNQLERKTS